MQCLLLARWLLMGALGGLSLLASFALLSLFVHNGGSGSLEAHHERHR